jgi:exodeoxyribonuclease VII small subunit
MMSKKQASQPQFEQMIAELALIVQQLEQGELSLDEALQQFERGILLARQSQQQLQAAEQKVQILLQPAQLAPFQPEQGE